MENRGAATAHENDNNSEREAERARQHIQFQQQRLESDNIRLRLRLAEALAQNQRVRLDLLRVADDETAINDLQLKIDRIKAQFEAQVDRVVSQVRHLIEEHQERCAHLSSWIASTSLNDSPDCIHQTLPSTDELRRHSPLQHTVTQSLSQQNQCSMSRPFQLLSRVRTFSPFLGFDDDDDISETHQQPNERQVDEQEELHRQALASALASRRILPSIPSNVSTFSARAATSTTTTPLNRSIPPCATLASTRSVESTLFPHDWEDEDLMSTSLSRGRKHKDLSGWSLMEKQFKCRPSKLDVLLQQREWRTAYHALMSLLLLSTLSLIWQEYSDNDGLFEFSTLRWTFGQLNKVVWAWMTMFVGTLLMPSFFQLWKDIRIGLKLYLTIYLLMQIALYATVPVWVRFHDIPTGSAVIVMCEQIRFSMKMHSFFVETYRMNNRRSEFSVEQLILYNIEILDDRNALFRQYLYFLWAPTLVYRNGYPRNAKIRWNLVAHGLMRFALCIWFSYVVFVKFCKPVFMSTVCEPSNKRALVLAILNASLPATALYVIIFFLIMHCWHNVSGELLRFADRQFYEDWYNSSSFSDYYRKNNVIAGDWLYTYAFKDLMRAGFSSTTSMVFCFSLSALAHEYLLSVSLGVFFPGLLLMFFLMNIWYFITNRLEDFFKSHFFAHSNFLIWTALFALNGAAIVLYSREWYAKHPPCAINPWSDIYNSSKHSLFTSLMPISLLPLFPHI